MFIRNYDYCTNIDFKNSMVAIQAEINNEIIEIPFDIKNIESNLCVLGGTRSGKTTFLLTLLKKLKKKHPNILFIILDVKNDFKVLEDISNDYVFSIKNDSIHNNICWSILKECYDSSFPKDTLKETIHLMFEEDIKQTAQPFFPEAAQDVLYGLLSYLLDNNVLISNKKILQWIKTLSLENIKSILEQSGLKYISHHYLYTLNNTSATGQSSGILSTLYLVLDSYFIQDDGSLYSSYDILKNCTGTVFLKYDIRFQKTCNNLMRLLLKLVIQNKLAITSNINKQVFLVLDEVSVLQGDFYLAQVLNIGAGKKISTILSLQSINLLYQCVGIKEEYEINSILGGFQNFICFRPRDIPTKEFIQHLGGEEMMEFMIMPSDHTSHIQSILQKDNIITSKEIEELNIGEAFIKILNKPLFKAKFLEYKEINNE